MIAKTVTTAAVAGALLIALVGCSTPETETTVATTTPTPDVSATSEAPTILTDAELTTIFTGVQFVPGEYASTGELIDSIYPGLTASDPSCLTPFGVGWDADPALSAASLEFGTSNDRSMTTVVSSTGDVDVASGLLTEANDALVRCAGASIFTMQGQPVQTTVEQFTPTITGTDETLGWRVNGDVGGMAFTLVGLTARVGGNVVALVGWDPSTNEKNVPLATQMIVDELG